MWRVLLIKDINYSAIVPPEWKVCNVVPLITNLFINPRLDEKGQNSSKYGSVFSYWFHVHAKLECSGSKQLNNEFNPTILNTYYEIVSASYQEQLLDHYLSVLTEKELDDELNNELAFRSQCHVSPNKVQELIKKRMDPLLLYKDTKSGSYLEFQNHNPF